MSSAEEKVLKKRITFDGEPPGTESPFIRETRLTDETDIAGKSAALYGGREIHSLTGLGLEDTFGDLSMEALVDQEFRLPGKASGGQVVFPSGQSLPVTTGPEKPGDEYYDPNRSGNPLLDTSSRYRRKRLSENFTVGELAHSGRNRFNKARIDPDLVQCLQDIRDFVHRAVSIVDGYYTYKYLMARLRTAGIKDRRKFRHSPHLSGRGAKIRVRGLSGLQLAKVIIITCQAETKASAGVRTAGVYVKQADDRPTSFIANGDRRERVIKKLRTFSDLYYLIPDDIEEGLRRLPGDILQRGNLNHVDAAHRFVHWAIHQKSVRDEDMLTEILFYKLRYINRLRDTGGLYNRGNSKDLDLWRTIGTNFVRPALARTPPREQTGGVPESPKGERDLADPVPDNPPADITGRYETELTRDRNFLGITLVVNQAGNHLEAVLSGVLKPDHPGSRRTLIRYNGDLQADGSFLLFSRTTPDVSRRLIPRDGRLISEYESAGRTIRQTLAPRSRRPVLMEQAQATFGKGRDRVKRHEWFPLLSKQVENLHQFFSHSETIGGYLKKFFSARGDLQRHREFRMGEAASEFEKAVREVIQDPDKGIHRSDFTPAKSYVRLLLSATLWRPDSSDPLLPQLDWIQRMVSVLDHNARTEPVRSGPFSARTVTTVRDLLGLAVGPVGKGDGGVGAGHIYTLTLNLDGATSLVGAYYGKLTVSKKGEWKETFKTFFISASAGGGLKVGEEFSGTLSSPINLLPRDFIGSAQLALGGLSAAIPGVGEASGTGGFLHIEGRITTIRMEFLEKDISLKLRGASGSKKKKPKISISGELTMGLGRVFSKKTTTRIKFPKIKTETDYTVIYEDLRRVHFGFNSAFLNNDARQALRVMCAQELPALMSPTSLLTITAHTDRKGKRKANLTLSALRAANTQQGIEDILGKLLKIPSRRIIPKGKGEEEARRAGDRDGTRNLDRRRVDVILNGRLVLRLRGG